jgi:hypothetical protein
MDNLLFYTILPFSPMFFLPNMPKYFNSPFAEKKAALLT